MFRARDIAPHTYARLAPNLPTAKAALSLRYHYRTLMLCFSALQVSGRKETEPSRRLREAMGLCRKRRQKGGLSLRNAGGCAYPGEV